MKSMAYAFDFLGRYHTEGKQIKENIVTGDEMCVYSLTLELKRQSIEQSRRLRKQSQHAIF